MGRLDQAAAVVGNLLHRMNAVEGLVAPGQLISNAQASEISTLVKAIATEVATRDSATGATGTKVIGLSCRLSPADGTLRLATREATGQAGLPA